jgi:hypothetical protein
MSIIAKATGLVAQTAPSAQQAFSGGLNYGFSVYNGSTDAGSFTLPVPPQEIIVDEPLATSLVPTIGASKFVERRGSIFKTLSVSGTFGSQLGLFPENLDENNTRVSSYDKDGNFVLVPPSGVKDDVSLRADDADSNRRTITTFNSARAIVVDYGKTAYAKFMELRNFFRSYGSHFNKAGSHTGYYMVWTNNKDGDSFVVEPLSFKVSRVKAHLYRYQVDLRVIGNYDAINYPADTTEKTVITKAKEVLTSVTALQALAAPKKPGDYSPPTASPFQQALALATGPATKMANGATQVQANVQSYAGNAVLVAGVVNAYLNSVARLMSAVFGSFDNLANTGQAFVGLLRTTGSLAQSAVNQATLLNSNILAFKDTGKQIKDAFNIDTSALKGFWGDEPSYSNASSETNNETVSQGAALTGTSTVSTSYDSAGNPTRPATAGGNEIVETGIDSSAVTSVSTVSVLPDETGDRFAARTVGNPALWPFLAAFNNLKPPYFSNGLDRLPNTVRPGDTLLIPVFGGAPSPTNTISAGDIPNFSEFSVTVGRYTVQGGKGYIFVDDYPSWRPNRWLGFVAESPSGERRLVVGNTETSIIVASPFSTALTPQDTIVIRSYTAVARQAQAFQKSSAIRSLGRDLQIQSVGAGVSSREERTFDLVVGSGDVSTVQAEANFVQAIGIKLRTQMGDLPAHMAGDAVFGLPSLIGLPVDANLLFAYTTRLRTQFLRDPRVVAVRNVSVVVDRDVAKVGLDVLPRGGTEYQSYTGNIL